MIAVRIVTAPIEIGLALLSTENISSRPVKFQVPLFLDSTRVGRLRVI
jgi:hypothetical protein